MFLEYWLRSTGNPYNYRSVQWSELGPEEPYEMRKKASTALTPSTIGKNPPLASTSSERADLQLPEDVRQFLVSLFSECNNRISFQLSAFPNAHEEALDLLFISHFAHMQGAITFGSQWTLRIDAHYIGGGRHYRTWEVADLGLMVVFRQNGKIVRSKLAFFQSKKLYASNVQFKNYDPYFREGMGRLLVTDEEHDEFVKPRLLRYSETSRYKALQLGDEQHEAISAFSRRFEVPIQYLLYNPALIPWEIRTPVEGLPKISENKVGARIISKELLDGMARKKASGYAPSYKDVRDTFRRVSVHDESEAGWRMEDFICDSLIDGNVCLIDDSPNFQQIVGILTQKSSPVSSALSITFDVHPRLLQR
jgi:hypothetical protein